MSGQQQASPADAVRNLVLISTAMGVSFVAQTMLLLTVPLRALELGAGPAAVGGLLSAPFWLPMLLAIPLGRLVTRIGGQRMMMVGAAGFAVGPWLAVSMPGLGGLLATQLVVGLMQISMGLSAQATIASLVRGKELERFFGWYSTSVSVGQLLGPLAGGIIISLLGTRAALPVVGLLPLISLACAYSLRGEAGHGRPVSGPLFGYLSQLTLLRKNAAVQLSLLVTVAMMFAIGAHAAFFPVYLESLEVQPTLIGLLVSMRALSSTAIRPFMAPTITFMGGRFRTVAICMVVTATGFLLIGSSEVLLILGLLTALVGVGTGLAQPLTIVTIADFVSGEERASALGMRLTVNQGAQFLGPLLLGLLAEFAGYTVMFAAGGVIMLGLLLLVVRLSKGYSRLAH